MNQLYRGIVSRLDYTEGGSNIPLGGKTKRLQLIQLQAIMLFKILGSLAGQR